MIVCDKLPDKNQIKTILFINFNNYMLRVGLLLKFISWKCERCFGAIYVYFNIKTIVCITSTLSFLMGFVKMIPPKNTRGV